MVRPAKKTQNPNLADAIKATAWEQIAQNGAAALSLRAIARALGITAPAIYNYYARRDDLVTALIVDAFNSLADAQEGALIDLPANAHAKRFEALGLAYRSWATSYPQRYQLVFGTPIPKYVAPEEITLPAAERGLVPLIQTLQSAYEFGQLRLDKLATAGRPLQEMLAAWQAGAGPVAPDVLYLALIVWSRMHGLVQMEISGHIPSFITDPGEVFRREIATLLSHYFYEHRSSN